MPILHSLSDSLEIIYHRDFRLLIGRFLRPLTEAENEQCYLDLLEAAHQHHDVRYWLLDIRRRHRSGPQVLGWLLREFYPRLVRELGPSVRVAYFLAPDLREEFRTDGTVPEPHTYPIGHDFRLNQCLTEAEAINWLVAEQRLAEAV
ncbi:MAG: hypothetical protein ACRYFX_32010 [Janthinobacterium lividum]